MTPVKLDAVNFLNRASAFSVYANLPAMTYSKALQTEQYTPQATTSTGTAPMAGNIQVVSDLNSHIINSLY